MMDRSCLSIILAAGEGTRMKSSLPKVLHKIAGLPLVCHVVRQVQLIGKSDIAVVVGRGADDVSSAVKEFSKTANIYLQKERLGTAHAVLSARQMLGENYDDVLIVFGDTPLIEAKSLERARDELAHGADIVVMGFVTENPSGYGRLIEKDGKLQEIVEEKDATTEQKKIKFCNGGVMALNGKLALSLLEQIKNENAKKEYYLTDIVKIGVSRELEVRAISIPFENVIGVNTRVELSEAEALWQKRRARELMLSGVTMLRPETVYFSYDTAIEGDVVIEPNVFFGLNVKVETGVVIHGFSHLEGAIVKAQSEIGPYARLRPGAILENSSKVGNFCEIKNAKIGEGAKVNHLTYIGDAVVGGHTNIGAGTITCNYDGFNKWKTIIGENAFIGSNSALVAPVEIGDGAYVASGSVITDQVPENSVAFGRARQINKEGRAIALRKRFSALKNKKE
ncbi:MULTISPECIES: bifunctional UDP-N-acetylglucosamine diphosphorylase/glucosamine-1-phosphate N-acetyltransferase GlmU [Bartonella]|uniref:bifunctional UDP-N-acetylglucosamine diphosphorylase/glucosamine-1-phosphate N-acetyltransferase GlmU n=1 Tax=Bartonella TaxID=773 RepID=UPI0018DC9207|nr:MULTISPECIES: bifunctional UDP-N-acetylglucosamine diphosphorylase/glucosamine-1-phosphate N-acetyltransferase GlmU [Bartonella]MBI0169092.1 bifunctional UDP-N-acetylglucosamine diphosphorylase/glucosamine-1-phosphate N-acetyltransferase GlmU [Bartonella sp. W8167]MBI0174920.1 bifunctional UDP-N-acetylglucosamine diphosphorylase/glucosamine-1-phosphate N-acetyltransferase GlmU [Bartonella apis]